MKAHRLPCGDGLKRSYEGGASLPESSVDQISYRVGSKGGET